MSEHGHEHHHHDHCCCANLFGCGDEKGTGIIREDIKDAGFDKRASDRLLHMDEVNQETFDGYLSARGRWRRTFLKASGQVSRRLRMNPKNSNKNEDRLRAQSGSFQSPFYEFTTSRLSLNFCRL